MKINFTTTMSTACDVKDVDTEETVEKKTIAQKNKPVSIKSEHKKKLAFHEKREYEALGIEIEQVEAQIKLLEEAMTDPEFFQADPDHVASESMRYQALQTELELKFLRYMELDERAG